MQGVNVFCVGSDAAGSGGKSDSLHFKKKKAHMLKTLKPKTRNDKTLSPKPQAPTCWQEQFEGLCYSKPAAETVGFYGPQMCGPS